jgi:hypothetical protein
LKPWSSGKQAASTAKSGLKTFASQAERLTSLLFQILRKYTGATKNHWDICPQPGFASLDHSDISDPDLQFLFLFFMNGNPLTAGVRSIRPNLEPSHLSGRSLPVGYRNDQCSFS